MKIVDLKWVLRCATLATLFCGTAVAEGAGTGVVSNDGLQAKTRYCEDCHGSSGQGYLGAVPIPRIAGQTTEYIESQLTAFVESTRDKNLLGMNMSEVHGTSSELRSALARYFTELDPTALADGPNDSAGAGKSIYEQGDPRANVPACSGCHGPAAKGTGVIPSLAGQLFSYTVKELTDWVGERRGATGKSESSVMTPIATRLTKPQIAVLASYLSHLE